MKKGQGQRAQARGHKRVAKLRVRNMNKHENLAYIARLIYKYEGNLTLKEKPRAGEKYLKWVLND